MEEETKVDELTNESPILEEEGCCGDCACCSHAAEEGITTELEEECEEGCECDECKDDSKCEEGCECDECKK